MRYPEIKQNFYEVFSGIHRSFLKLNCENLKQTHQWRRKTQRLLEWSLCGRRRGPVFFSSEGHFWDSAADGKRNNVVMRLFEDSLRSGVTRQRLFHWRQLILSHKERGAVVYFTKLEPGQGGVGGNGPAAELLRSETPSGEQSDLDPSKPEGRQHSCWHRGPKQPDFPQETRTCWSEKETSGNQMEVTHPADLWCT